MKVNLLAWNFSYPTLELFGQLTTRSISDLPFSLSSLSGADVSANPGFDFFAMPMPQAGSSKIVFTSNRDGNAEIYSMNADGSGLIRLTTNAYNDDHPRWSPNGTKILFQSDRDNPETGNADIYVMNANGTSQTRLTYDAADDSAAEWSPDGSKIVFQSLRNGQYYQVYVMNADGMNQVNTSGGFAADFQPSWSPDGSKIAFASERDHAGRTEVYVMNANGSNQTRLTVSGDPFRAEQPAWSRDATKIAFVSTRDSVIETWQETDDDGAILNRSRVRTNKEVYKMNADGSNQIRLTNTLENDDSPYWSPDGTQIIFRSERERDSYDPAQQLWTMNADGTNPAIINSNEFGDYSASWKSTSNQPPVASAGGPYSGLSGSPIQFNGGGSFDPDGAIASYQWNFGDNTSGGGTPTHSYSTAGSYTVTLTVTDNDGATASATATATVANNPPVANPGGPYSGVTAQNIPFSGSGSSDSDGMITSYAWSFGDGGTGSGAVPTHAYTSAGTYTVTLTVTDNQGEQASANTSVTITVAGSEQYLANFNQAALARPPSPEESAYWNDILRAGYANGQNSMLLAVRELGKTLFESAYYSGLNRNNHWYVYDLYKTYLMREPDAPGWAWWENECNSYGRDNVRRAFDESIEFANIVATLTPVGSPSSTVGSFASARVDPFKQPGNGLAARDAEWSVPLLSLPGRAGLDLGLSLSYSSMVWTRSGPYIYFDEDNGTPSPGFRLGFPTIQEKVFDARAGENVYLMLTGGNRVSLRQIGTSNVYEAADSSYLQLIDNGGSLLVSATDGTQITFEAKANGWQASQVKDRNGNLLIIYNDWRGDIQNITDTLGRVIRFNYDPNLNLNSITQDGRPQPWATFGWGDTPSLQLPSGAQAVGTYAGETLPVLTQIGLPDGSRYNFEYNSAAQVNVVRRTTEDNVERSQTVYNYGAADDATRLTNVRVSADNWTGVNAMPAYVETQYNVEGNAHTITVVGDPSGTVYKEFYGTGWQKGLITATEIWGKKDEAHPVQRQKWTSTSWVQDDPNPNALYRTNPRVTATDVFDNSNHSHTVIGYQTFTLPFTNASCSLPNEIYEYAADQTTVLRRTHTDYNLDSTYLNRRIVGLPRTKLLYDASTLAAKTTYEYDWNGEYLQGLPASPTQHDGGYSTELVGRGNLVSVRRWDVNHPDDISKITENKIGYDITGNVRFTRDASNHQNSISYADSFADGNNSRNTFAYPTTLTDADGHASYIQYSFDLGAKTRVEGPPPGNPGQYSSGIIQTFTYDEARRVKRATVTNTGAYSHYEYGPNYTQVYSSVNTVSANPLASDSYSVQVFDGLGRAIAAAKNHPGSVGGYSAVMTVYDRMGRAVKQSNPTETTATGTTWPATGDDAYNAQTGEGDWRYTEQTYDWQGRPLITTNPDGSTKEANYSGCGCAGGAVVTLADELVMLPPQSGAGVWSPDRRKRKVHTDVLGRSVKSETLNRDGTPYTTTVNDYNARDQVTAVKEYKGAAAVDGSCPAGTCQQTTTDYDGHGRLESRHTPEQNAGTFTVWKYKDDDTIEKITDARGASRTFGYNARHLVTGITYAWPGGGTVPTPASFGYDAAGNRTSMTDSTGSVTYHYDQLSRMDWEERTFAGLPGSTYRLTYGSYNLAGQLTSLAEPSQFGSSVGYGYDVAGRLKDVTGSGFAGGVSDFASNLKYRASGALKEVSYGNGLKLNNSFNSRLQITGYQVKAPGTPVGEGEIARSEYEYEADGRIKRAYDRNTPGFDRSYSYDLVGRLGNAVTSNSAYYQNFSYDEFDHLTGRSNGSWRHFETTVSQFQSNRNIYTLTSPMSYPSCCPPQPSYWTYDADGNVAHDHNKEYTYDAAGNKTRVFETTDIGGGITKKLWIYQDYDANGVRAKRVEQEQYNSGPYTFVTSYYLRSSVLNGKVITELNEYGQKRETNVYANGMSLLHQKDNQVLWTHTDPVTKSTRETNSAASMVAHTEFDPLGNDAPLTDPLPPETTPDYLYPGTYDGSGNIYDGPSGCMIDGQQVPCSILARVLNFGTGRGIAASDGTAAAGARSMFTHVWVDEWQDVETPSGTGTQGPDGNWTGSVSTQIRNVGSFRTVSVGGTASQGAARPLIPQNRVPLPGNDAIRNRLNTGDCNAYIASVLAKVSELYGKQGNVALAKDGLGLLAKISTQGGFVLQDHLKIQGYNVSGTVRGSIAGNNASPAGTATVLISTRFTVTSNPATDRYWQADYINTAIHEMLHLAGRFSGFSDRELAVAASQLPNAKRGLPDAPKGPNDFLGIAENSGYFDRELRKHCGGK